MAGGTWTVQNKVRPGVYLNINSEPRSLGTPSDRGIVALPMSLHWGEAKKVIPLQAGQDLKNVLGYDLMDPSLLMVREAFKRAKTVLLYRLNEGTSATATHENLTITAVHGGVKGNDLSIVIQSVLDDPDVFQVRTLLAGKVVDTQKVVTASELKNNGWCIFQGEGPLTVTAGLPLKGGTDGEVTNGDHSDFLAAIEVYDFHAMALPAEDPQLKALYTSFVKRLRDQEGKKVQAVLENYPTADYEGIISVKNGVILADGTILDASQATAWVAAATAAAAVNQSLTYQAYDDAVDVDIRYTNSQIEAALLAGEFVFVQNNGRAIVEQDVNSFTSFGPEKSKTFSKNRVVRVLDGLSNDIKRIFESFYIGKVNNDVDGRGLLKNEVTNYLNTLQDLGAVQNFNAQTDLQVLAGVESDSVYIEVYVQPVDSIEKIYMKVTVR